ncbi:fungal-specific transcription factor domain-containing protein [Limtongia smithiae]|uniref:fungal-specific transcription factor domain-containing protein n=1 Tax=Limtongia smithiae TaxID=1125753 RepID=UPI0034CD5FB5
MDIPSQHRKAALERAEKKLRRPRASQACERCRVKKYKCDEEVPCSHCKRHNALCAYQRSSAYHGRSDQSYIQALENKVMELTTLLNESKSQESTNHANGAAPLEPRIRRKSFSPVHSVEEYTMSPDRLPVPQKHGSLSRLSHDVMEDDPEVEATVGSAHSDSIEFHGCTSSISVLDSVQKRHAKRRANGTEDPSSTGSPSALISTLHNSAFLSHTGVADDEGNMQEHRYYFRQAHIFIEGYFDSLHIVHPFIDKKYFLSRAQELWFRHDIKPAPTFVALYLSLLSLGALIRVWDEPEIDGMSRFEWSRKLFKEAEMHLNSRRFQNDLDTVHCLFLMTKICQNELIPHLAYMYLGSAIRTCLSAGFNREPLNGKKLRGETGSTWWSLYSLDIEMSFSLGRPDTLGFDEYHNRYLPKPDDTEYAIIPCMVELARITRKVAVTIYHSTAPIQQRLETALAIEKELNCWVANLPLTIRPVLGDDSMSIGCLREPEWHRRQRLVLSIRYHNVRMLLFRPFLAQSSDNLSDALVDLADGVNKCAESAQQTIRMIYDNYRTQSYFRTWWYNTTYVLFASSILLLLLGSIDPVMLSQRTTLINSVELAVEIFKAMDESFVAKKLAELISNNLMDAKESNTETIVFVDQTIPNWTMQITGLVRVASVFFFESVLIAADTESGVRYF